MNNQRSKPIAQARAFRRSGKVLSTVARIFSKIDAPTHIETPDGEPFVLAANHRSFFDFIVAWKVLNELGLTCHCLIRADLFDKPIIGSWLKRNGCIPASRETREEAEKLAISLLDSGYSVAVMPEGRLVPENDRPEGVGKGRPGISRIARSRNLCIIPVGLTGTEKIWPIGKTFPRIRFPRHKVSIKFGKPMRLSSNDDIVNVEAVMGEIKSLLY
ncbi:MAG: 1-acyl-sn-glycerol-3-phosphate acyltransferase [Acidimicrobiales bacterium]|nr:1-acyl-sn-glycerol-3-phosphate acyltransferase [Acidimicrobiales bacterium]